MLRTTVDMDLRQVDRLMKRQLPKAVSEGTDDLMIYTRDVMRVYGLKRGTQYRRTFAHRRGVVVKRRGKNDIYAAWTDDAVPAGKPGYAIYLRKHGRQARVHRGRWSTDKQVSKMIAKNAPGYYERKLKRIAGAR